MSRPRATRAAAGLTAIIAATAVTAGAVSAKSSAGKADSGTVYTAITHTAGGFEYAAGNDVDKLFGNVAATYKIKAGATKSGITLTVPLVQLFTSTGELSGTGTAKLAISGTSETVTDGTLRLTKGTGAQKGHTFKGTFSGTGSTTTSQYVFHVKGTYK